MSWDNSISELSYSEAHECVTLFVKALGPGKDGMSALIDIMSGMVDLMAPGKVNRQQGLIQLFSAADAMIRHTQIMLDQAKMVLDEQAGVIGFKSKARSYPSEISATPTRLYLKN